jgi:hypothetical protein
LPHGFQMATDIYAHTVYYNRQKSAR